MKLDLDISVFQGFIFFFFFPPLLHPPWTGKFYNLKIIIKLLLYLFNIFWMSVECYIKWIRQDFTWKNHTFYMEF